MSPPAGYIEDQAMRAVEALAAMDPATIDLEMIWNITLTINQIRTRACQAQMKVAAE